jgi:hypothetical protein
MQSNGKHDVVPMAVENSYLSQKSKM